MMKPKAVPSPSGSGAGDDGLLEFLEDVIGTVRYKTPLKKLQTRIDRLLELRAEKVSFLPHDLFMLKFQYFIYYYRKLYEYLFDEKEKQREISRDYIANNLISNL